MQHPYLVQFQADLYRYRMAIQLRCDALAALRAMDTMIEHFEDMGFANSAPRCRRSTPVRHAFPALFEPMLGHGDPS